MKSKPFILVMLAMFIIGCKNENTNSDAEIDTSTDELSQLMQRAALDGSGIGICNDEFYKAYPKIDYVYQFKNLIFYYEPRELSEADKLNGIKNQYAITIENNAQRLFSPPNGWSDWGNGYPLHGLYTIYADGRAIYESNITGGGPGQASELKDVQSPDFCSTVLSIIN